ncbi:MAG: ribonuclease III [Anaerolineae bacterium]|nr:ribonuclease III [Anaerolineae bacterium]
MNLQALQARLGVQFDDLDMLTQALTHRSYGNDLGEPVPHYERLEFLGDAILDFLAADFLYTHFPDVPEGDLTNYRAALVKTEALAGLARMYDLGDYIRISKGDEASGGRNRDSLLCDVFEALIGTIYLQKGLDGVRQFITPLFATRETAIADENVSKTPRSRFQEWAEAVHGITPRFEVIKVGGQQHLPNYEAKVYLGDKFITTGHGQNKRIAAQNAAQNALTMLAKNHPSLVSSPSEQANGRKPDAE